MRVPGPTLDELDVQALTYEREVTRSLRRTLERALNDLTDMPGFDDLASIRDLWASEVDTTLLPGLGDRWYRGVNTVREGLDEPVVTAAGFEVPPPTPDLAELWLRSRRNNLVTIGDDLWITAREQLVLGLQEGDDPDQLTRRVRRATGLVEPQAHAIARTESNGALNAGSITQIRLTGQPVTKEWVATHDGRTRPSHLEADGQVVGLNESFLVGGSYMDRPHDLGAPADESVNCRCTVIFNFVPSPAITAALLAAAQDPAGAMIALVPSEVDLDRLVVSGGEPREQLHLTLAYLGDGADWSTDQRDVLVGRLEALVARGPVEGNVFGAAYWNPDGPDPAWVLNVGGEELEMAHGAAWDALRSTESEVGTPSIPEQHAPWVPHICVAYDQGPADETYDVWTFRDTVGPVTFDRLRIAFADEATDLVLGDRDLAAAACLPCSTLGHDPTVGGVVPYDVRQGGGTCGSSRWAVVNRTSGRTMGCHDTKADARKQQAAINVHESAGVTDPVTLIALSQRDMYRIDLPDEDTEEFYPLADETTEELEVITDANDGHFASVDNTPWDGGAAMAACDSAACYRSICAGRKAGPPDQRSSWALPHHKTAGGPPNAAGVRNALSRLPQAQGLTNKAAAQRHLEAHMSSISNAGLEDGEAFAPTPDADGNCPDGYRRLGDNCVPDNSAAEEELEELGGKPSSGTDKDRRLKTNKKQTRGYETIKQEALAVEATPAGRWYSPALTVEGRETGDGREFDVESLDWAEMPLTLTYQPPSHGGQSTDGHVVGRIDEIWRDGEFIRARGVFDMKDEFAANIARQVKEGFLKGVSVDVDDYAADMEYIWPEGAEGEAEDGNIMNILFGRPEKVVYHHGRIRGAAVVPIPAFVEATIQFVDEDEELAASGVQTLPQYGPVGVHDAPSSDAPWDGAAQEARLPAQLQPTVAYGMYAWLSFRGEQLSTIGKQYCHLPHHEVDDEGRVGAANVTGVTAALRALEGIEIPDGRRRLVYQHLAAHLRDAGLEAPPFAEPVTAAATEAPPRPPAGWFTNPKLSVPTPITVDNSGRVYGHAAQWGQCHVGFADLCVTPPREDAHPYFMTGEVETVEGDRVAVGQITLGTGHAPTHLSASQAAEHYDHTGAAVADVCVGNDQHGIWVAGAVRPEVEEYRIRQLRAAGQVSGDWRRIGGLLRLVGLLAVNVPGFPVPRLRARVASGVPLTVVAAGQLQVAPGGLDEQHLETVALEFIRQQLAARVARTASSAPAPPPVAAPTSPDVDRLRAELAARVQGTTSTEEGGD